MITRIGIDKFQEFVFFRRTTGERHYRLTEKRKLFFNSFVHTVEHDINFWSNGNWYFVYDLC